MLARKKSNITYRAFQLGDDLPPWYEEHAVAQEGDASSTWVRKEADGWSIRTLEGLERATDDDWCVEGAKGEYYPMSDEAFRNRYDPAPEGRWRRRADPTECWSFDTVDTSLMPPWVQRAIGRGLIAANGTELTIRATWGDQLATLGNDVLIHASDEDIYSCKLGVFNETYEVLDQASVPDTRS